ncbi:unnamed protein product [Hermetia illucens]|uniref:Netrin receptor UNC5 n=1 Tax=Hermetia illucens TaxID=343691 RepID=A0A7R8UA09_HERIL|nr:netrin receptor unc-5 isoform X2 [Hermetia illucens]CAD7076930.1 unnamed protein product [Hermetia illucens]
MIFYNVFIIYVLCLRTFGIQNQAVAGSINRSLNIAAADRASSDAPTSGTANIPPLLDNKKPTSPLDALKPIETKPKIGDAGGEKTPPTDHGFGGFGGGGSVGGTGGGGAGHFGSHSDFGDDLYDEDYDGENYPDKGEHEYKATEYEERQLDPMLDSFGTKLEGHDSEGSLPLFLVEPQSTFVVKNRPATLKCKAAHALKLSFKCSGSSQPPPSTMESHVDPHNGVHLVEVTATISRDLVDEYFGKTPFRCDCHAWSSRGGAKSQGAVVEVAYIRKTFTISPTSIRAQLGGRAELQCSAPSALPPAKIAWYKNNVPITPEHPIVITPEGSLHIEQISLQDMANYTCVAENIAGKRTSDPAALTVYVDGGWSAWSSWMACKCPGKSSQGRKRVRSCTNPVPQNGGSQCEGPDVQKTPDCISCPAGRWSPWSEWSSCSADCIQIRRRKCITHTVDDAVMGGSVSFSEGYDKSLCFGKDFQTAECRGGSCRFGRDDSDWPLYLGLTVITVVCIALGAALIRTARRGRHIPPYNMARTVMQSDYLHDADKKAIHFHSDTGTANYEYPTAAHRPLTGGMAMTRSISEHHYDVPNLASTYTTPIDGLSSKYSYATDTADTATSTSDSTYDVASEPPTLPMPPKGMCKLSTTREVVTSVGGFLKLYKGLTTMYIPDMAVGKNAKHTVSLSILTDECSRIITSDSSTYLSPVVYCGPVDLTFNKAIILKIPHCMVEPDQWTINVYYSGCFIQEANVKWRKAATIGEETINTPIFVQIDKEFAYVMTEQLGRFVIVGEPFDKAGIATKKMKLIVFGQVGPANSSTCSLRVYIVDDFPNCKDMCSRVESQLGGTFMGESPPFIFQLNNCDFNLRLNCAGEWQPAVGSDVQTIPYNHMLNSNSILHCEFSLQRSEQPCIGVKLEINYSQSDDLVDTYMFVVPYTTLETTTANSSSSSLSDKKKNSVTDRNGTFITEIEAEFRLPRNAKRLICGLLDPPRADGNDWRLLANILNVDRYIAYFATKQSPTEHVLNLWECRNKGTKAIVELMTVFKEMDRQDVVDVVEQSVGPLWF